MSLTGEARTGRRGRTAGGVLLAFFGALFVTLMVLSAVALVDSAERDRFRQSRRTDALLYGTFVRAKLEGALHQRLRIAYGLGAFARSQFDELPANFYKFAEALVQSGVPGIRSLQLAPNAVVRYVYPFRTNEKVMGHDLLADPTRREAVLKSIEERLFVVAGPVDLLQSGRGIIARLPLYREVSGREAFWGFATIVADLDALLAEAGLMNQSDYVVAVRGADGKGARGAAFFGDADIFDADPVTLDVALPAGAWQIAVMPRGGWPAAAPISRPTWAIGILLALVAGGLTLVVLMAPHALRREVARATQALRESEEQFRRVAESATDAIVSADEQGRIVFWNGAAEAAFGHAPAEAIGAPVGLLIPERYRRDHDEAFARIVRGDPSNRAGRTVEAAGRRKDGSEFPIELSTAVWSAGGATYVTAIIRDITERKQAEREQALLQERFHEAQRMEAIGTLTSGAAHEFNNILNSIMANADSAAMQLSPDEPVGHAVHEVQAGAWRAADIVRQLLVFSERVDQELMPVSLARVVEDTVAAMRPTLPSRIDLRVELAEEALVLGDPGQLRQVVGNLLVNGVQALNGRGGRLTVAVARVDGPGCPVTAEPGDAAHLEIGQLDRWPAVALTVVDEGCGMNRATMSRIFEPFFTTRSVGAGTGLGLSVVHGIVQRCGGTISVRSGIDKGTAFTVYFPATDTIPAVDAATAAQC